MNDLTPSNNEFEWDKTDSHEFIFGEQEDNVVINPEDVIKEVEKDKVVDTPADTKKKPASKKEDVENEEEEEEEIDHDFSFGEYIDEDNEEDDDIVKAPKGDKDKEAVATQVDSKSTLTFLKEKGLVDFELEEGEELTDELAEEKLEDYFDSAIEQGVEESIKDLPDALKNMIKFVSKGGNFDSLLAGMVNNVKSGINKNSDIEQEDVQILAVRKDLEKNGYDADYIDTHIQVLKDSGKLATIAKKVFDKDIAEQENFEQAELQRITKANEEAKRKQREFKSSLSSHVTSLKDINGLTLTPAEQKELPSYIADANVELENGKIVSGLQRDLFKIYGDKDKLTLLAKLVKSDFDFSSLTKKQETKRSKEIRENIQNTGKNIKGSDGSSQKKRQIKSVADLLDD